MSTVHDRTVAAAMLEDELQANVIEAALWLGCLVYHTHDSRRSPAGFPDLVIVHQQTGRAIFAELKRENERPTPAQEAWLRALARRHEAVVWRPSDWLTGTVRAALERIGRQA